MKANALNRASLVLSFAGIFISGVLSIGEYYKLSIPCGGSHGCNIVAMDPSSHALGIPNAYLGLIVYFVLAILAWMRLHNPNNRNAVIVGYGLSALGTLGSIALTYYSVTVIGATCLWCLSSGATMILSMIVHAMLMQLDPVPDPEPSRTNSIWLAALLLLTMTMLGIEWRTVVSSGTNLMVNRIVGKSPELFFPKNAHVYGDPNAPVTLIEFGDLMCPACQNEYSQIKAFLAKHPGKVNYVFRHFPMYRLKGHEQSAPAAIISEIAAEKGHFWQFADAMYSEQREGVKDTGPILEVAASVGVNDPNILDRVRNPKDPAFVRMMKDVDDGSQLGVAGTPTFFIMAKGIKGVLATSIFTLFDDLDRPEYKKLYGSG